MDIFVFILVAYLLNMICLNLLFLYKIVYIYEFSYKFDKVPLRYFYVVNGYVFYCNFLFFIELDFFKIWEIKIPSKYFRLDLFFTIILFFLKIKKILKIKLFVFRKTRGKETNSLKQWRMMILKVEPLQPNSLGKINDLKAK